MAYNKPTYKDGFVVYDNGSIDPKGFVGVKKDEFKKMFAGKMKADIDEVWDLVSKNRPKNSSTTKKD